MFGYFSEHLSDMLLFTTFTKGLQYNTFLVFVESEGDP